MIPVKNIRAVMTQIIKDLTDTYKKCVDLSGEYWNVYQRLILKKLSSFNIRKKWIHYSAFVLDSSIFLWYCCLKLEKYFLRETTLNN